MVDKITLAPTASLLQRCTALDVYIKQFLANRANIEATYWKFEATIKALNLFNVAIRCVEGVIELAKKDMVLVAPAAVAARTALEAGVRAAWMVDHDNLIEREARWSAHFRSEETYIEKQVSLKNDFGLPLSGEHKRLATLKLFRTAVDGQIASRGGHLLKKIPNFREALRAIGQEWCYALYVVLCQTSHGTHAGTWQYRSGGVGTERVAGELISEGDWELPMVVSLFVFERAGNLVLTRLSR